MTAGTIAAGSSDRAKRRVGAGRGRPRRHFTVGYECWLGVVGTGRCRRSQEKQLHRRNVAQGWALRALRNAALPRPSAQSPNFH